MPMSPYQAGAQLGELAFGAPENASGARNPGLLGLLTGQSGQPGSIYYNTLTRGADAGRAMDLARMARTKAIAQQGLGGTLESLGVANPDASANAMLSGVDLKGLVQLGDAIAQRQAQSAANSGDLNAMNRNLAVLGGKPVDLTTNQGNTLLNQFVTPDLQANGGQGTATQLGNAIIGANNALVTERNANAGAANARAGASRAQAGMYGAHAGLYKAQTTNPEKFHTGRGGSAADDGGEDGAPSEAFVLDGLRKRIASGQITPAQAAKFAASRGYSAVAKKLYPDYALDLGDDGDQ